MLLFVTVEFDCRIWIYFEDDFPVSIENFWIVRERHDNLDWLNEWRKNGGEQEGFSLGNDIDDHLILERVSDLEEANSFEFSIHEQSRELNISPVRFPHSFEELLHGIDLHFLSNPFPQLLRVIEFLLRVRAIDYTFAKQLRQFVEKAHVRPFFPQRLLLCELQVLRVFDILVVFLVFQISDSVRKMADILAKHAETAQPVPT